MIGRVANSFDPIRRARGERFTASGGQGSKLDALIGDKTVLQRTLDAVISTGLPWHLKVGGIQGWAKASQRRCVLRGTPTVG